MPKAGQSVSRQPKRPFKGHEYEQVGEFESNSTRGLMHHVFIQLDRRLDPAEQVENADLYCECMGWQIPKNGRRTCSHVERPDMVRALENWKRTHWTGEVAQATRRAADAEPWLPDLRAQFGLPETDPVYVREDQGGMGLYWGDENQRRVPSNARREVALIRQALTRPDESLFYPWSVDAWLEAHPVGACQLPWAPGLGGALIGGRTLACPAIAAPVAWGDAVMGGLGLERVEGDDAGSGIPTVDLGDLPRSKETRRARCADALGGYWLCEIVQVSWRERGRDQVATLTVEDFLRRVGLDPDARQEAFWERLRQLLGVSGLEVTGGKDDDVSPYTLWRYRSCDGRESQYLLLNTAQHSLWFGTGGWEGVSKNVQDLVRIVIKTDDDGRPLRAKFALDPRNPVPFEHRAAEAVLAVGAELALRLGCPPDSAAEICRLPDWEGMRQATLTEMVAAGDLPQADEAVWHLTPEGHVMLAYAVAVQAFAMQRANDDRPAPEANELVSSALERMARLLPEVGAPPEVSEEGDARLDVLDWLLSVQTWLTRAEAATRFGSDAALIVSGEVYA